MGETNRKEGREVMSLLPYQTTEEAIAGYKKLIAHHQAYIDEFQNAINKLLGQNSLDYT